MQVIVRHVNTGAVEYFHGEPEQIVRQLLVKWPWAYRDPRLPDYDPMSLNDVVGRLNRAQNFMVEVEA